MSTIERVRLWSPEPSRSWINLNRSRAQSLISELRDLNKYKSADRVEYLEDLAQALRGCNHQKLAAHFDKEATAINDYRARNRAYARGW